MSFTIKALGAMVIIYHHQKCIKIGLVDAEIRPFKILKPPNNLKRNRSKSFTVRAFRVLIIIYHHAKFHMAI